MFRKYVRGSRVRLARLVIAVASVGAAAATGSAFADETTAPVERVDFRIELETVLEHDDGEFLWFHPRAAAIPAHADRPATVLMTIQKHLFVSDFYSGLYDMRTTNLGETWDGPRPIPALDWQREASGVIRAVADVTPGWHAPTERLLAVGAHVRYSPEGAQLDDIKRAHQTAYAVYDPAADAWTGWQMLEMPSDVKFDFARSACAQWVVSDTGTVLLPFYLGTSSKTPWDVAVVECDFDGQRLTYRRHGNELSLDEARGLYEPSLIRFGGRYYQTIRNDHKGYVSVSDDGLEYGPIRPWTFDDGSELGSYNTQQHWLAHSDGLFLCYTRKGANNDHITRHRAPLFIAQVDPERLVVLRDSERVLVPERGATLGNFGANPVNERESWVTVSEGLFGAASRQRGATGATFVARVIWSKPNQLTSP